MPKFELTSQGIQLVENDRGNWHRHRDLTTGSEFVGFGGENSLIILLSLMQSGDCEVVAIHGLIDSLFRVKRVTSTNPTDAINKAVEGVCTYPEEL